MFGLFTTIIIGLIVGLIAKVIMPGKENLGFLLKILLVATYPGQSVGWYEASQSRRLDQFDCRRISLVMDLPEVQVP